jgi:hypothetical protein
MIPIPTHTIQVGKITPIFGGETKIKINMAILHKLNRLHQDLKGRALTHPLLWRI